MPIYVYRCEACQAVTESLQKVSDAPLVECPECGEQSLKKILSPVGIVFKGSGFHKNDYSGKSSSKSTSEKKETTPTSAAAESTATAAPATPAASTSSESSSSSTGNSSTSSGSDKVA